MVGNIAPEVRYAPMVDERLFAQFLKCCFVDALFIFSIIAAASGAQLTNTMRDI